jgi:type II secretion system protein H
MRNSLNVLRRCRGGFSLIELLVAMVILAILATMALPSMGGYVDRTQTRRALDQLTADFGVARMHAVERARPTRIVMQTDGSYTIQAQSADGTWATIRSVRLRDNFPGVSLSAASTVVQFSSRGLVTNLSGDGLIRVTRNSVRDSLFISPAGRVYRAF